MAKIVVMDDEEAVRSAITRVLQRAGHEVLAFEDAAPALDEVNFEEIDLVLTDLVMPTPGDQFILVLQQEDIEVPVIVLSANLNEERIRYLEELGTDRILEKPFDLAELLKVVEECLK